MKKFKHYLVLLSVSLLSLNCFSQNNITSEWLINSSGEEWDVICDMIAGNDSSLFIAGNYTANSKINEKTTVLSGDNNSFILKLNNDGNELWQTHLISSGYTYISSLSCDSKGMVYACGTFKGNLNIGSASLPESGGKSLFILKLDKKGNVEMLEQIKGNFSNGHINITNNSKNELILAASFKGGLNFASLNFTSKYFHDILIAKFNPDGKIKKANFLHGKMDDFINDIICDGNDDIYITGSFKRDLVFSDKVIKTAGDSDVFLMKINEEFEYIYTKQIGGIYDDYGKNISIDNTGNVILSGSFAGELSLSEGSKLSSNGVLDVFIIKFDKAGNLIWAESFGGGANDYVSSMTLSSSGNIYIDGTYRGTIEKDDCKIKSSDFSNDIFLAKYDAQGEFRYIETAGDTNVDYGRKLISDTEGYIYLSGDFSTSLILLDKETTEAIGNDFFISRLYDCEESPKVQLPLDTALCSTELVLIADPGFDNYLWNGKPGTFEYTVDSTGLYTIEAIDGHNCFSWDTVFVQLNNPPELELGDTIIVQQGEIISLFAPFGMEEYLWNNQSTLSFLDIKTEKIKPGEYLYWVEVTDKNECTSLDEVLIKVIENNRLLSINSLNNDEKSFGASIYPNPAKEKIMLDIVDLDINGQLTIEFYSQEGNLLLQEVNKAEKNSLKMEIEINFLPPGTYLLLIKNGANTVDKKVVIL